MLEFVLVVIDIVLLEIVGKRRYQLNIVYSAKEKRVLSWNGEWRRRIWSWISGSNTVYFTENVICSPCGLQIASECTTLQSVIFSNPINFKLGTITFRAIHTGTPTYLICELHKHQQLRALRSGTTTTLYRPHASSDFHQHSFCSLCTGYLEQYTCFHPRFWHLGHLQNCSQNSPL